jgi:hypothetical protein
MSLITFSVNNKNGMYRKQVATLNFILRAKFKYKFYKFTKKNRASHSRSSDNGGGMHKAGMGGPLALSASYSNLFQVKSDDNVLHTHMYTRTENFI